MSLFVAGCASEDMMDDEQTGDMADSSSGSTDSAPVDTPVTTPVDAVEDSAPVAVSEGEVSLTRSTFDPDTLTVTNGATITFVAVDGPHLLADDGAKFTGRMNAGERADYTFEGVGEHKVFDALFKAVLIVTVTE